jgi:hypothetical protein
MLHDEVMLGNWFLGGEHADILLSLNNLGTVFDDEGKYDDKISNRWRLLFDCSGLST